MAQSTVPHSNSTLHSSAPLSSCLRTMQEASLPRNQSDKFHLILKHDDASLKKSPLITALLISGQKLRAELSAPLWNVTATSQLSLSHHQCPVIHMSQCLWVGELRSALLNLTYTDRTTVIPPPLFPQTDSSQITVWSASSGLKKVLLLLLSLMHFMAQPRTDRSSIGHF